MDDIKKLLDELLETDNIAYLKGYFGELDCGEYGAKAETLKAQLLTAYRDLSALYASSQSHVAELLADNRDLRADLKTARDALVIGGRKRAKLEQALTEIRDLARTGLPPMSIPAEYWPEHKCNRIAAEANHALEGEE